MGGPGSTRWGMILTRQTTESLPRLDVRDLARAGALAPGVTATIRWAGGASVTTSVRTDIPDCLGLAYEVRAGTGVGMPVVEWLRLRWTPCTFGGTRRWVVCPGCGSQRAVLYAVGGHFRCRGCHRLAYRSTRVAGERPVMNGRRRPVVAARH